jgi:hypothetical protein
MGPVEIVGAIRVASEATKTMLAIKEIASSAEAKLALATVQLALADAKEAAASLKDENAKLKNEITEIKKSDNDISKFIRRGILFIDDNSKLFKCPTCIEKDKKIITLSPNSNINPVKFHCNACQSDFQNPDWRSPQPSSYKHSSLRRV